MEVDGICLGSCTVAVCLSIIQPVNHPDCLLQQSVFANSQRINHCFKDSVSHHEDDEHIHRNIHNVFSVVEYFLKCSIKM